MPEPSFVRRTWIDIDLDRLAANYRTACSLTKSRVTCVLKANAYGHGLKQIAEALAADGCRSFAVSCAREALALRRYGIGGEILVMGLAEPECLEQLIRQEVTLTAASAEDIRLAEAAATAAGRKAVIHLKIDTGFHRLGFGCDEAAADTIAAALQAAPHVLAEGLYSHLGLISRERDIRQHEAMQAMLALLKARGVEPEDIHLCDSIGLVRYPEWHMSRVRVGALLFGSRPIRKEDKPIDCGETLAFRTTVAQVRAVAAGEPVGYSDDFTLSRDSVIATLCAGYGDGYPRRMSNGRGQVSIRGQLAPVIGLVCMDQMMVDVTGIPGVCPGDTADLLGGAISYQAMADMAGTNRNECLTILSARPVRVYRRGGKIVEVRDDLADV